MKIKIVILISIFIFSCKNSNARHGENKTVVTKSSANIKSKEESDCDKYNEYLDSIPYAEKLNSKVSFGIIKCKLFKNINLSKYNYAKLLSKYSYKGYSVYLYRLNCIAGGGCGDYFTSIINKNFEITDTKLIASEISEGENNITINSFKFNQGKLSFEISPSIQQENYSLKEGLL